jgi:hypothetical protein
VRAGLSAADSARAAESCRNWDELNASPASAQPAAASSGAWLVGATPAEDFLDADVTEALLRQQLGSGLVLSDSIYVGEGMFEPGTVLYPADSSRRLEILWQDSIGRRRPRVVVVRGGSRWRVYPGVGIGTTLRELDSLNGRAFSLAGFGWDYGGTLTGYQGGRLDSLWGRGAERDLAVQFRLSPPEAAADSLLSAVLGDRDFSSRHPAMYALNPRVYEILVAPRRRSPAP